MLLEGRRRAADVGVSSEAPASELGASASPPKAPLIVSEKNSSPENTRRIVDRPKVACGVLLAGILAENTGCDSISDLRSRPTNNEAPSNVRNNMKGRALSFENLTDLCGIERALTTAWAFARELPLQRTARRRRQ